MNESAKRLKQAMEIKGINQQDLAQKSGIGKSNISRYLSGAYEPKSGVAQKLATALGVSPLWLMCLDNFDYSSEWKDGMEPYYPVNDEKNSALYAQYRELAEKEHNVHLGGRLAEYKYYDMAPIIEKVMKRFVNM